MNKESITMLSYALATENDAVAMYRFMIQNLPKEYKGELVHILNEEKEHAEILKKLIDKATK